MSDLKLTDLMDGWSRITMNKDELKSIMHELVGDEDSMDAARETNSALGATYTIGYNSAKRELHNKIDETLRSFVHP